MTHIAPLAATTGAPLARPIYRDRTTPAQRTILMVMFPSALFLALTGGSATPDGKPVEHRREPMPDAGCRVNGSRR